MRHFRVFKPRGCDSCFSAKGEVYVFQRILQGSLHYFFKLCSRWNRLVPIIQCLWAHAQQWISNFENNLRSIRERIFQSIHPQQHRKEIKRIISIKLLQVLDTVTFRHGYFKPRLFPVKFQALLITLNISKLIGLFPSAYKIINPCNQFLMMGRHDV